MRDLRWLPRLGPPIAALGGFALLGSASLGATAGPGLAVGVGGVTSCGGIPSLVSGARAPAPATADALEAEAVYRIDPQLAADGALAGQRVEVGTAARTTITLELPPESFAAGPFGDVVLIGSDDGRRSTVRAVDATSGCVWPVATETDVVRRATLDSSGTSAFEFRVDRATRADLGVWRRQLRGGPVLRVLPPLTVDDRWGPTFTTELSWSTQGDVLVVQSCGATSCRTRLLEVATDRVRSIETEGQGEIIGLAGHRLIGYAACRGLPCAIRSTDVTTGETAILAPAAGLARLVATDAGPRLVHETGDEDHRRLAVVDPASGESRPVATDARGLHVVPASVRAAGETRVPPGWLLLTPDGRNEPAMRDGVLVRLADGQTFELKGVQR